MDLREKFIGIVCDAMEADGCIGHCNHSPCFAVERVVNALIENGTTVQEWIPVTERLPKIPDGWAEHPDPVLYMMKSTKTIYAGYYGEGGTWRDKYFRRYVDWREGVGADDVLCWMYQKDLPEPPKGD